MAQPRRSLNNCARRWLTSLVREPTSAATREHAPWPVEEMQCFLAHSYVVDEPCPLKCWQAYIYANYCSTKVLNQVRGGAPIEES